MKLLLIDDNELDRIAIKRAIRQTDMQVDFVESTTGEEGLRLFDSQFFDLVITDFQLPDIDGLDILNYISKHPVSHAAVIVVTGHTQALELEEKCLESGAQDILFKSEITHKHIRRAIIHGRTRHRLERQLQENHDKLRMLAENDSLTGLSNRYFFDENLRSAIFRAKRQNDKLALMFVDLDNFKTINDTMGHDAGDQILKATARRLQDILREGDMVCRLGGDEFAVLAYNFTTKKDIMYLAQRLLAEVCKPFSVEGQTFDISASVGIATYPEAGESATDLLKAADLAMYCAKRGGKNNYYFYTRELQDQAQERLRLEKELRALVPTEHFVLYFQPIIHAKTLCLAGAESLVRWRHPVHGILPPSEFIPLAEEIKLIAEIDTRSRLNSFHQLARWRKQHLVDDQFVLHFNICAQLLEDAELIADVERDLQITGLPAHCLGLEVTESVLISNLENSSQMLSRLRELGMDIAVDDFGTGYSSLAYLKSLPAKTLKIDRTFVKGVPENSDDARILRALIVFGKTLDLTIIVEGVETIAQARFCIDCGADYLQGYLFAKPSACEDFENYLAYYTPSYWRQALQ